MKNTAYKADSLLQTVYLKHCHVRYVTAAM